MLFPRPVIHGVYVLCYLSRQSAGAVAPAKEIASRMGVPREQASKILQSLAGASLVHAHRGRQGGYSLQRPLGSITLADVFTAIYSTDGQERFEPRACPTSPTQICQAQNGLRRMHERFWSLMRAEPLSQLLEEACLAAHVPAENLPATPTPFMPVAVQSGHA